MKQYLIETHWRGNKGASSSTYHLIEEETNNHVSISGTLEGIYDFCCNHRPRILLKSIHLLLSAKDKLTWERLPLVKCAKLIKPSKRYNRK